MNFNELTVAIRTSMFFGETKLRQFSQLTSWDFTWIPLNNGAGSGAVEHIFGQIGPVRWIPTFGTEPANLHSEEAIEEADHHTKKQTMSNPDTKTAALLDLEAIKEVEAIIGDPARLQGLTHEEASVIMTNCYRSVRRIRSGGRSARLACLTALLWKNREHQLPDDLNPEDLLALGFHLALDPSLLFPEWGVALSGVLLAGFADRLSDSKDQTLDKCWRFVDYLRQPAAFPSTSRAAEALLKARHAQFAEGLNEVILAGLSHWPETADITSMSKEDVDAEVDPLNRILPALWTDRQRKVYRLFLERNGSWNTVRSVSLN